jgi:hypothetical protein
MSRLKAPGEKDKPETERLIGNPGDGGGTVKLLAIESRAELQ